MSLFDLKAAFFALGDDEQEDALSWVFEETYNRKYNGKICTTCGQMFYADAAWKTECIGCWRISKSGMGTKWAQLQDEVQKLRGAKASAMFTETEMKFLLKACHPDKHGDNEHATDVTRKVIAWRNGKAPS